VAFGYQTSVSRVFSKTSLQIFPLQSTGSTSPSGCMSVAKVYVSGFGTEPFAVAVVELDDVSVMDELEGDEVLEADEEETPVALEEEFALVAEERAGDVVVVVVEETGAAVVVVVKGEVELEDDGAGEDESVMA
jgi:hypothetical protein